MFSDELMRLSQLTIICLAKTGKQILCRWLNVKNKIRRRWACWPQHASGEEKNYSLLTGVKKWKNIFFEKEESNMHINLRVYTNSSDNNISLRKRLSSLQYFGMICTSVEKSMCTCKALLCKDTFNMLGKSIICVTLNISYSRAVKLPINLGKRDNTKTPKVLVTLFTWRKYAIKFPKLVV